MAYYDYFKDIKPTYALPPYGDIQGGRQAQALGAGRYKPYSEMVRAQAERLPAYYALAQQQEWQKGIGEQQQDIIDIEEAGLKQDIIEAENLRWQRERELDEQRRQNRNQLLLEAGGLAGGILARTARYWGPPAKEGLKYLWPKLAPYAPYLAPVAIAATWGYGLKEATKGRSHGQTARAIAEGGVGAGYTPTVEAVNLALIKDYGMNKSAYDRTTMEEIDKLIMQYGGDKENLGMLYNSILSTLESRTLFSEPEELEVSGTVRPRDARRSRRGVAPDTTVTPSQNEAIAGAVVDIVEQIGTPAYTSPARGTRYTSGVLGGHEIGYYQTPGVERLLEELYGEPTEDEEGLTGGVSKMALSMGMPEEENLESIRQKIAIGRL